MRDRVSHVTRYHYGEPVDLAAHLLHLTPRALPGQTVLDAALAVDPPPGRSVAGTDHFGNAATWLFLAEPHAGVAVTLTAAVDVVARRADPLEKGVVDEQVAPMTISADRVGRWMLDQEKGVGYLPGSPRLDEPVLEIPAGAVVLQAGIDDLHPTPAGRQIVLLHR